MFQWGSHDPFLQCRNGRIFVSPSIRSGHGWILYHKVRIWWRFSDRVYSSPSRLVRDTDRPRTTESLTGPTRTSTVPSVGCVLYPASDVFRIDSTPDCGNRFKTRNEKLKKYDKDRREGNRYFFTGYGMNDESEFNGKLLCRNRSRPRRGMTFRPGDFRVDSLPLIENFSVL